jgi:hypothetical protein
MLKYGLILLAMLVSFSAAAQTSAEMLILDEGQWLAWSPATRTLREISPDEAVRLRAALNGRDTAVVLQPLASQFAGMPPANLIYVDAQGQQALLTGQPNPSAPSIVRSEAGFSPDGRRFHWVEYNESLGFAYTLVVLYDPETQTRQEWEGFYDIGYMDGGVFIEPLAWNDVGLYRTFFTFGDIERGFDRGFQFLDPQTSETYTFILNDYIDASSGVLGAEPLIVEGRVVVAVLTRDGVLYHIDLLDKTVQTIAHGITGIGAVGGSTIVTRLPDIYTTTVITTLDGRSWRVDPYNYAVNSAGDVLFREGNTVYTHVDGGFAPIYEGSDPRVYGMDLTFSVNQPFATLDLATVPLGTCPLPPRLQPDAPAFVIPGMGVNVVREGPGLESPIVGRLAENQEVTVSGPPVCGSGYVWWGVSADGVFGYTPEGDPATGTYWLANR